MKSGARFPVGAVWHPAFAQVGGPPVRPRDFRAGKSKHEGRFRSERGCKMQFFSMWRARMPRPGFRTTSRGVPLLGRHADVVAGAGRGTGHDQPGSATRTPSSHLSLNGEGSDWGAHAGSGGRASQGPCRISRGLASRPLGGGRMVRGLIRQHRHPEIPYNGLLKRSPQLA